jgi:group I intron endonuclease
MKKDFYVYMHIKETEGTPFYIGKGSKERAYSKHRRSEFWKSIVNKYGFDVIIIEDNLYEKDAFNLESYWIKRIGRRDLGLGPLVNFSDGGEGPSGATWKHSEETKIKLSKSKLGELNPMYGKYFSKEHREKLSKAGKGKVISEKQRLDISLRQQDGKAFWYGKELSENHKKKISEGVKGKLIKNPPIEQFTLDGEFIREWTSAYQVHKELNLNIGNLTAVLKGKRKICGGFIFKYKKL